MRKLKHITENRTLIQAGGMTIGVYLLFGLLVRPDTQSRPRPKPPALQLSYSTQADSRLQSMHALWSPVLFSFPARQGFSAPFLNSRDFKSETTRNDSDRFQQFLERPLTSGAPVPLGLAASNEPKLQISVTKTGSVFEPAHAPAPSGAHLKVAGGLAERLLSAPELPDLPAGSWQHTASITVNTHGQVTHAFIEPGSPAQPAPPALLSALHRLRFQAAATETQGRVTVYSLNGSPAQ